ncbi:hypothetical protein GCM10011579_016660 [Streptomyces albiflavescens]|uniref:Uncharacterized protein n=1 Tax=Streptomyces albiflavescens TaxID=1623582 RepID=A0A917XVY8_9ACTN|nr:hypothetical protein GCM10011579_016660 [Streptomyces albiflavescens]
MLSTRTAEYRSALTPPAGVTVLLNGAAGICLLPLDPARARAYLERDAGGPGTEAAARWHRVTASLGTSSPVSQALSTPLGLFLARTIYNPRPDEHLIELAHPDELLDQARFPAREDINTHLFAAFIPAAYRPHPHLPTHWTAQKAQRTLSFLACHLQRTLGGSPNLAWWQLSKALPKEVTVLTIGLTAWLVSGIPFGLFIGLTSPDQLQLAAGLAEGLVLAIPVPVAALLCAWSARDRNPSSGIRWSWKGKSWLTCGLTVGLALGLTIGLPIALWLGLSQAGLVLGLVVGLSFGLIGGLRSQHPDLSKAVGPGVILARDRRTFSAITLAGGLMGALVFTLAGALMLSYGMTEVFPFISVLGIAVGLLVGFLLGLARSVWMEFLVARTALAAAGRVPWRFMRFLADAHERRGVLRQAGAVYQFRHLDLQRHLAQRHLAQRQP